jgi:hypothetical protein
MFDIHHRRHRRRKGPVMTQQGTPAAGSAPAGSIDPAQLNTLTQAIVTAGQDIDQALTDQQTATANLATAQASVVTAQAAVVTAQAELPTAQAALATAVANLQNFVAPYLPPAPAATVLAGNGD